MYWCCDCDNNLTGCGTLVAQMSCSGTYAFEVFGAAFNSGGWFTSSDRRLKNEIQGIENGLRAIKYSMVIPFLVEGMKELDVQDHAVEVKTAEREARIDYFVPAAAATASIVVTDMNGLTVLEMAAGSGKGAVEIPAGSLTDGVYFYSLVIDGEKVKTRRMVLMK